MTFESPAQQLGIDIDEVQRMQEVWLTRSARMVILRRSISQRALGLPVSRQSWEWTESARALEYAG